MIATTPAADQLDGDGEGDGRTILVVGSGDLAEETVRAIEASGACVSWLPEPCVDDVRDCC